MNEEQKKRRSAGNYVELGEGKYRLRYKGKSKNIEATSPRDLNKQLSAFVAEVDKGQFIQSTYTFKEFAEKWLKEFSEINHAPKNTFNHRKLLENRIYKAIGHLKLEKVTPLILTHFYNSLRQEGARNDSREGKLSERTIQLHHKTISCIFKTATMWEVFNKSNPCRGVVFPEQRKQPAKFYDDTQIRTMFKALESEDIEYQGTFEKDPKTQNSYRTIAMPEDTMKLLEEYKKHQQSSGFLCADNNPVFVGYDGKPKFTYWLSAWFPAFLKRHGLPHLNFHGTRHSSASYLLNSGMNINAVADRLGDTPATILNTYAHALRNSDREAAAMFNNLQAK